MLGIDRLMEVDIEVCFLRGELDGIWKKRGVVEVGVFHRELFFCGEIMLV